MERFNSRGIFKIFNLVFGIRGLVLFFSVGIITGCGQEDQTPDWFLNATYYESCSCQAPCPCPFGLPMTNSFCKINSLLEVHSGRYDSVDLKGAIVILSGSTGNWGEFYFSESISEKKKLGLQKILKEVNIGSFDTILTSKREKIVFQKVNGLVLFSTPHIQVEMRLVLGENNQPIAIQNLKGKLFESYTPYFSVQNVRSFSDASKNFSFEKKAGFTSQWNLTSQDFE